MGSKPPPQSPISTSRRSNDENNLTELQEDNAQRAQEPQLQPQVGIESGQFGAEMTAPELRRLLQLRDQKIQALEFELEKYKLALHQSQLDYHSTQRQLTSWLANQSTSDNVVVGDEKQGDGDMTGLKPLNELGTLLDPDDEDDSQFERQQLQAMSGRRRTKSDHQEPGKDLMSSAKRLSNKPTLAARLSSASLGSSGFTASRVVFKTGAEGLEDDDDEDDDDDVDVERLLSQSHDDNDLDEDENDDLEHMIQDVGEIDLNLELETDISLGLKKVTPTATPQKQQQSELSSGGSNKSSQQRMGCPKRDDDDNELGSDKLEVEGDNSGDRNNDNNGDDEDVISDGLLTSLTDAAISNLSQLAALQERCESQQQHSHPYQQQSQQDRHQPQQHSRPRQHSSPGLGMAANGQTASSSNSNSVPTTATITSPTPLGPIGAISQQQQQQPNVATIARDPFSVTAIANQAAIAINAAASIQPSSSIMVHTQQPVSSSSTSSLSPTSTVQASDLNSSHSLASVVAAAAVAAAAANDHHHQQQHQQQQQQQLHHQQQHHHAHLNPQSRLISSVIQSPDFYHSFQQHHAQQQQQNIHQQPSPVSSLHTYSPTTPVTPSSSSLLAQSRRSACSNASSSLMSPIASPNYLRRQFMPDRLPLMSPSPTSGLTTGSSSAASTSLAHILNHHHNQQRSGSALSGPVTSTSSTPLGSSGSTAVSPLMSNKNSSQARLNNMQIRHKFGYLGSGRAQFNSPHGFCLGLNQEIVVADTNNHRVCIFDKSGSYITQFGSPGKEEGQLWNPRKVAILHRPSTSTNNSNQSSSHLTTTTTQNQLQQQLSHLKHHHQHLNQQASSPYSIHINNSSNLQGSSQSLSSTNNNSNFSNSEPLYVVCDRGAERSRMQLFTKDGAFIKKIGIHYIDIVAGLAITQDGLIIVVDSVSPTVYIINGETGVLNGWFDCSGHMKEPSDIAVKSDVPGNEYFICDFKGHCVVVFSEQGEYLRKIGQDGLTSYPNGIDISDDGDILVGDSHGNRFHVVVFDRNGNFVSQFECPHVKVSRCCGLKITREGYIVTLAKNNHHVLVLDTIHI